MSNRSTLQQLIDDQTIESSLARGSQRKGQIIALQNILKTIGFKEELSWERYGADGDYGGSTKRAVASFIEKNGLTGDGSSVSIEIGTKILARFDIVDDLQYLQGRIDSQKVGEKIYRGSSDAEGIIALQTLLNELGYGAELKWERYGADGQYGSSCTNALKTFAQQEGVDTDGRKLTPELAEKIVGKLKNYFGNSWYEKSQATTSATPIQQTLGNLTVQEVTENKRARVYISNGTTKARFSKFRKGVYTYGQQKAIDFINANPSTLSDLGMTTSEVNVMISVSENEGNLDAINTWDNSYMTFGMFQWTIGAGKAKGELPALAKKIKAADASVFENYYGQYGVDIVETGEAYGYFTIAGNKIDTPEEKDTMRGNSWVFYFWNSGQDPVIQSVEIQHALSRLGIFYKSKNYKVQDYFISDLITSEYGVALILDNHVNRPGYLKSCIAKALEISELPDPSSWTTDDEYTLTENYLKVRETYGKSPMTDAAKRATVTKKYLDNNIISKERGSFQYSSGN